MANRLQSLNGLWLSGEGKPRNLLLAYTYLASAQHQRGRQYRLVTSGRVLNPPGIMVCDSEKALAQ